MRLLFVCFEYLGDRDACSLCIEKLRRELLKRDISSDVLSYDWQGGLPPVSRDDCGSVYLAPTWYRYARMQRRSDGSIAMSPLQWGMAAAARGISILLEGKSYAQRGFTVAAADALGRRMAQLCRENGYDWVISVAYPFVNHRVVLKWRPVGVKVALYNLDPYYNNQTYAPVRKESRLREEVMAYEQADCVFCTPEQLPDYQHSAFDGVREKIHSLAYPKMEPLQNGMPCTIAFEPEYINCLYLGTIYSDIRRPDGLLKLFEMAIREEPRLRLYIVGKKFGSNADQYLREYQNKLGEHLVCLNPIPGDQTADAMQKADVLVNLGNTMQNQQPSKIFDYIASGKPVLNVSMIQNCNSIPLLRRHPLVHQCFNETCAQPKNVATALAFLREAKGKSLSWEQIKSVYPEELLPSVATRFSNILAQV